MRAGKCMRISGVLVNAECGLTLREFDSLSIYKLSELDTDLTGCWAWTLVDLAMDGWRRIQDKARALGALIFRRSLSVCQYLNERAQGKEDQVRRMRSDNDFGVLHRQFPICCFR